MNKKVKSFIFVCNKKNKQQNKMSNTNYTMKNIYNVKFYEDNVYIFNKEYKHIDTAYYDFCKFINSINKKTINDINNAIDKSEKINKKSDKFYNEEIKYKNMICNISISNENTTKMVHVSFTTRRHYFDVVLLFKSVKVMNKTLYPLTRKMGQLRPESILI